MSGVWPSPWRWPTVARADGVVADSRVQPITARWVAQRLPSRPALSHKGTFGRVLVVGGSLEYSGAVLLAALGAARSGAGLVAIASAESVIVRLAGHVPEIVWLHLAEEAAGLISPTGWRRLATEAEGYDALVIGPGLGAQPATRRRAAKLISEVQRPMVIDADALNALATTPRWWHSARAPLVLTPHPGEFARLTGAELTPDDDEARAVAVSDAAVRFGKVVILKGARTVVASPDRDVLRSDVATPALATAGSGDVLAGAVGAFLAGGLEPLEAATIAVAVHGAAGLLAEERIGRAGVMAGEIAGLLPVAIERFRAARRR